MMSDEWKPTNFVKDPIANAILNVAAELNLLATKTGGLLYGLKYDKDSGMSIAEAIEVGLDKIASSIPDNV
jgi:hypothetical protein